MQKIQFLLPSSAQDQASWALPYNHLSNRPASQRLATRRSIKTILRKTSRILEVSGRVQEGSRKGSRRVKEWSRKGPEMVPGRIHEGSERGRPCWILFFTHLLNVETHKCDETVEKLEGNLDKLERNLEILERNIERKS